MLRAIPAKNYLLNIYCPKGIQFFVGAIQTMKTPLSNNNKCTPDERQRWYAAAAAAAAHNVITIIIQPVLLESLPNR